MSDEKPDSNPPRPMSIIVAKGSDVPHLPKSETQMRKLELLDFEPRLNEQEVFQRVVQSAFVNFYRVHKPPPLGLNRLQRDPHPALLAEINSAIKTEGIFDDIRNMSRDRLFKMRDFQRINEDNLVEAQRISNCNLFKPDITKDKRLEYQRFLKMVLNTTKATDRANRLYDPLVRSIAHSPEMLSRIDSVVSRVCIDSWKKELPEHMQKFYPEISWNEADDRVVTETEVKKVEERKETKKGKRDRFEKFSILSIQIPQTNPLPPTTSSPTSYPAVPMIQYSTNSTARRRQEISPHQGKRTHHASASRTV